MQRKTEALHRSSAGQGGKDGPRGSSSPTSIEFGMQLIILSEWSLTCVCQEVQSLNAKSSEYIVCTGAWGPAETSRGPVTAQLDP
jgi:hypothetical protein